MAGSSGRPERLDSGPPRQPARQWPFVRGLVVLYETLVIGTRWLMRRAGLQAEDEGVEIGKGGVALMLGITAVLGIGLFFILPLVIAHVHGRQHRERLRPALRRGPRPGPHLHRLSRADQPHAGHPPRVHVPRRRAHDDPRARGGQPLRPEKIRRFPTAHPRCGTEFLVVVILISIIAFSLAAGQTPLVIIASRIPLIPVIAAVGYEVLRIGAPGIAATRSSRC